VRQRLKRQAFAPLWKVNGSGQEQVERTERRRSAWARARSATRAAPTGWTRSIWLTASHCLRGRALSSRSLGPTAGTTTGNASAAGAGGGDPRCRRGQARARVARKYRRATIGGKPPWPCRTPVR
jgi:hypothetical protein